MKKRLRIYLDGDLVDEQIHTNQDELTKAVIFAQKAHVTTMCLHGCTRQGLASHYYWTHFPFPSGVPGKDVERYRKASRHTETPPNQKLRVEICDC